MDIDACCLSSIYKVDFQFSDAQPICCMLKWLLVDLWVCSQRLGLKIWGVHLWDSSHHVGLTICGVAGLWIASIFGDTLCDLWVGRLGDNPRNG